MAELLNAQRYLDRLGFGDPIGHDLPTLAALQRAHLTAVPFENLHVFHGLGVRTDLAWSVPKVVDQRRGGWCFELNGAFAALLEALGFDVLLLGAAVLLDGPNVVIDHLAIEVALDQPYLVDVGFGDSFIAPLALNRRGEQDGGNGLYELLPSSQGTTLASVDDGVPTAQYRFKRVAHVLADFDPASNSLQADPALQWRQKPFAARLLEGGPDRVTLLGDRIKFCRAGETKETPVAEHEWEATLIEWFGMGLPHGLSSGCGD